MRKLVSIVFVFLALPTASFADQGGKKSRALPAMMLQVCQPELSTRNPYDDEEREGQQPGYSNTDEQDDHRNEPGPDEVEDRNPDEEDAMNPGGF